MKATDDYQYYIPTRDAVPPRTPDNAYNMYSEEDAERIIFEVCSGLYYR